MYASFRIPLFMALVLPLTSGPIGCASSSVVRHQEADATQTAGYATFRLNEPTVGETDPELYQLLVRGLEAKGYRQVDQDAELVVTYKLLVAPTTASTEPSRASTAADDMFSFTPAYDDSQNKVLLVLIQDARTLDAVWVGWSQADAPEDEVESRARVALGELVDRIPARSDDAAPTAG